MIGLGIDTGGTCTDAVLYDMEQQRLLSSAKTATTKECLEQGIETALGMLDVQTLARADFLALSTTLATNACVENRGCRVKLLFIGVEPEIMENVYQKYGFDSMDDILFIKGVPEGGNLEPVKPEWDRLSELMPAFAHSQAIGIVQLFPGWNEGAFEKKARDMIAEHYDVPIVCGSELFSDLNAIRRGAGTYLNSRLIPIIQDFFRAVKISMRKYHLELPVYIVRSDGSLMNETYAAGHPVETLLCGPAASVLGGAWMADADDALVIDMGGTTTDIGMLRAGRPVHVTDGVLINHWKTFVKGMAIDTFGLGGDTAVRYKEGELYLEEFRVVPLSMVAQQHPEMLARIRRVPSYKNQKVCPYEGFLYIKDPEHPQDYRETQRNILTVLREQDPLFIHDLSEQVNSYVIEFEVEPLEREGLIQRFGLTPTDMMHIKGDYTAFNKEAVQLAIRILSKVSAVCEEEIPDRIYRLVEERMYANLVRILFDGFEEQKNPVSKDVLAMAADTFEPDKDSLIIPSFHTDLTLVGVGGPIHIFLPAVAKKMATTCQVFADSRIANAIGTLVGRIRVAETAEVESDADGYYIFSDGFHRFDTYEEAQTQLVAWLKEKAENTARKRGAVGEMEWQVDVKKLETYLRTDSAEKQLFGSTVTVQINASVF